MADRHGGPPAIPWVTWLARLASAEGSGFNQDPASIRTKRSTSIWTLDFHISTYRYAHTHANTHPIYIYRKGNKIPNIAKEYTKWPISTCNTQNYKSLGSSNQDYQQTTHTPSQGLSTDRPPPWKLPRMPKVTKLGKLSATDKIMPTLKHVTNCSQLLWSSPRSPHRRLKWKHILIVFLSSLKNSKLQNCYCTPSWWLWEKWPPHVG